MSAVSSWRRVAPLLALILLALALVLASPPRRVEAEGTFISAPGRVDTVYDLKRDILYISYKRFSNSVLTASGVLRYQVGTGTFLNPIPITGNLMGLDLSPDGSTLLVADLYYSADRVWVHEVDLRTLEVSKAEVPRDGTYEGGTFAVAFGNDGAALVTSTFLGSGWTPLRRYDPATHGWTVLGTVTQSVMVSASPDGSVIGFVEANISDGRWGRYRVSDGNLVRRSGYTDGTSWFNFEIAVKNGGSQYAIPTYNGTYIYDGSYTRQTIVGTYAASQPIGGAYHPFDDLVYFAWGDRYSVSSPWVRAHRTSDFAVVGQYDFQNHFDHTGNGAFGEGRVRIARDGSYLFCTVDNGVRFVQLGAHRFVAGHQTARTLEDGPVALSLYGYSGATSATFYLVDLPGHGTLSGTAPDLVYTPAPDFNGTDSFTFRVSGGGQTSNLATVTLVAAPVNDPPSFQAGANVTVPQGAPAQSLPGWATQITSGPTDESGQTLTFQVTTDNPALFAAAPALSAAGTLTFTPAASTIGTAHVTARLVDNGGTLNGGVNTSQPQSFTITIGAPNRPPAAADDTATIAEDTATDLDVLGNDTDPDGDVLTLDSATQPASGAVQLVGGKVRYTPVADFNGEDAFTYKVRDPAGLTSAATVRITVTPVNDPPSATSQSITTAEDTATDVTLSGADPDGDPLTYRVVSGPAHGSLSGTGSNRAYTPAADYAGTDAFTFTASDGQVESAPVTVSISVSPVNDVPLAISKSVATPEDSALAIAVSGSDADGDSLAYAIVTGPAHGALLGAPPNVTYQPAPNYFGSDSFTFQVSDGQATSAAATVSITVLPVNDAPRASADFASTTKNLPVTIGVLLNDSDPDGDVLRVTGAVNSSHGTVVVNADGTLRYTPKKSFTGTDRFTYTVSDGRGGSASATVTVSVGKR